MKRPRSTLESPEVPAKRNCGCAVHPEPTSSLSLGYRIQERILTHYDYVECPSISNKEEEERYYNERNVAWCYNQAKGSVWKCTNKANYDHYTDEMLGREFVIKNVVWVGPHYHECATIVYNKIVGIRLDDSGRDQYVLEGVFRSFSAEHFRNMCVPLHYDDV